MTSCFICDRVAQAARGSNPTLILEMESGYAVLGDNQFLRGYCLLLLREHVRELHDLPPMTRELFLWDMAMLGEALWRAVKPSKINYAMLGNTERDHLHCHVHARYADEPEPYRRGPVTGYPKEIRDAPAHQFSVDRDAGLITAIRNELLRVRSEPARIKAT